MSTETKVAVSIKYLVLKLHFRGWTFFFFKKALKKKDLPLSKTAFETHFSGGASRTSYSHFKPLAQHRLPSRTTETQKNQSRGTDLIKY